MEITDIIMTHSGHSSLGMIEGDTGYDRALFVCTDISSNSIVQNLIPHVEIFNELSGD